MQKRLLGIYPLLLVFYEMAAYLSNDLYLPALPSIMHDLKISSSLAQTTLTAWFIGSASLQLILGPISDRFGRRPVLLYSGILFVAASGFCAIADNITMIIIARFFQGMVVCAIIVAGYASIHELLESEQAVKTLAWMGGVAVLAPAFGPLFGGVLLLFAHWRWLFVILAIWGAIVVLMLRHWMPESLPPEKRVKFDLNKVFKDYWLVICNHRFLINMGSFCLIFAGLIVWIVVGPLLIIRDFHLTPVWFGLIQLLLLGSYIIGTWVIKFLINDRGIEGTLKIALPIILLGGVLSVLCAYIWPHRLFYVIASLMIVQFGSGLSLAPLNRLSIESVAQPMGIRVALFSFLMGWFGVIGSASASIFYNGALYSFAWLVLSFTFLGVILKGSSLIKSS
jgi:MFS transporter, DHA1 family, multidrug resistance protein